MLCIAYGYPYSTCHICEDFSINYLVVEYPKDLSCLSLDTLSFSELSMEMDSTVARTKSIIIHTCNDSDLNKLKMKLELPLI